MNSEYVSQPASQSSSRMQSPVVYNPKLPWTYKFQKFINKIPPAIRYGLPGVAIGVLGTKLYQAAKNKYNSIRHETNNQKNIDTPVDPKPNDPSSHRSPTEPNITPIPRSTYNPAHPRTGYRYFPYLN